jgi:hypothetical protein
MNEFIILMAVLTITLVFVFGISITGYVTILMAKHKHDRDIFQDDEGYKEFLEHDKELNDASRD